MGTAEPFRRSKSVKKDFEMLRSPIRSSMSSRRPQRKSRLADDNAPTHLPGSVDLGDRLQLGEDGPVATVVGIGSGGTTILAWREGRQFYEAAYKEFAKRPKSN
jgi:hypothetical protein